MDLACELSEEEWMEDLAEWDVAELKLVARRISRHINNKLHGNPLYGINDKVKDEEELEEDDEDCREDDDDFEYNETYGCAQCLTIGDIKRAQQALQQANVPVTNVIMSTEYHQEDIIDMLTPGKKKNSFGSCAQTPALAGTGIPLSWVLNSPATVTFPTRAQESAKENDMNTQTTTITEERRHLTRRLNDVRDTKISDAYKHFNVEYFPQPKTGKELKEWLANGRVQVLEAVKDDDKFTWDNPIGYLEFVDPDKKRDKVGYEKVRGTIYSDAKPIYDRIALTPEPITVLPLVEEFEKRTFH